MIAKPAAVTAGLLLAVLLLPLLAVPGAGGSDLAGDRYRCGNIDVALTTIRTLESDGDYTARAANASASGAYQYIDSTWRHWADIVGIDTTAYPSAYLAPPPDQDSVAAANVRAILREHNNDVAAIPIIWYYPAAYDRPDLMDIVPLPEAGNTLTPRQYQTRWIATYQQLSAATTADITTIVCNPTISPDGDWALPLPHDTVTGADLNAPHHDYPASDLAVPTGTPVFAITAGTVERTTHFNANWWTAGCGSDIPPAGCATCGLGITIETGDGSMRHTYCHNSELLVADGDPITTGQLIARSGNTGRSGQPHLHLEIRIHDTRHCPQPLLVALYDDQPAPAELPTNGCTFTP